MLKKICSWLLAAATAAAVFLPQVTIYAAQTTVISVADYGADPSGKTDSTKAVADAIAAAAEIDGAATVVFPTGRYDFYPETSAVRELYISNTVGADQNYKNKKIGILIEDADNITIDGQGSTFIYHGKMSEFAIINSTNITLKNFTADFEVPTVVDVTVESI
jgi:polygalacturonase